MKKELKNCVNKYELMPLSQLEEELRMAIAEHQALEDSIGRIENEIYKRKELNEHGKD